MAGLATKMLNAGSSEKAARAILDSVFAGDGLREIVDACEEVCAGGKREKWSSTNRKGVIRGPRGRES